MRAPELRLFEDEIVVDNFAGGGGASEGMAWALGRPPDVAINHNAEALAMHRANHPDTVHLQEDVRDVVPEDVARGRRVGLAWFSPDCTHFSKAKGGKPDRDPDVAKRSRGLAWVAVKWAQSGAKPRMMFLENVEEFQTWEDFRPWVDALRASDYALEHRELRASPLGAPTARKRLLLAARRDGRAIRWPEACHVAELREQHREHYARTTAADCIDFSLPMPSIFLTPAEARAWGKFYGVPSPKRPLAVPTLRRIARGVYRYVIEAADPFIINVRHTGYERDVRIYSAHEPLRAIPASDREFALVAPTLINTRNGERLDAPMPTITTGGNHGGGHIAAVSAFLIKFYGTKRDGCQVRLPLDTVTTRDRFGLVVVQVAGEPYALIDIGMRMLTPRELFLAQGFPADYEIDTGIDALGQPVKFTKKAQTRLVGNSVPPHMAAALVRANLYADGYADSEMPERVA